MTAAVYVSNAESGDLTVFALDETSGRLRRIQDVAVGGMLMPIAISPDRRRLHVARRSDPLAVVSFAIDAGTGRLSPLGEAPLPHSMAYIATDRAGRQLLSASYGGNLVAVSPVELDGLPRAAQQVIAVGAHAHCIQADPSNRNVYATSLGANAVMHWRFDAASGQLAPATPFTLEAPAGAGARHFVFNADGSRMYLLGELDGSVCVLDIDAGSGTLSTRQTLSTLPPGFAEKPWASDLHLRPDGRFLYTCERRSSTIAILAVDAMEGTLGVVGHVDTETQPRGFAIDPRGGFLVAAGQLSHRVSVYRIDAATGALNHCDSADAGRDPNWIEIVPLAN